MSDTKVVENDYELSEVPMDKRRSFSSITIVWTGYVFLITSMMAGGGLAAGLTFKEIIITTSWGTCSWESWQSWSVSLHVRQG